MGYSFGQGLLDFATGVGERAREYDTEEAKRIDRLAEIKAKRQDELLKTRWTDAKKKRDADITKIDAITSAGGIDSIEGQAIAKGYDINNIKKMLEAKVAAGDGWKWSDMPVVGEEPTLQYSDEEAITKAMKGQQGSTLVMLFEDLKLKDKTTQKEAELTEKELGKASTYRRGEAKSLTEEQIASMNKWVTADDDRLDIEKKAAYHFKQYSNSELFPEYVNASPDALKRLAYDVASGTVKVTPEGMPWNIQKETISSYSNELFNNNTTPTPEGGESYETLEARKKAKEASDLAKKQEAALAKKKAEEARAVERTVPSKVTTTDVGLAGNILLDATYPVKGKQVSFMDELSDANKNTIETDVAGNVNVIINQTRMSQTEAYDLATAIAKSGITHEGDTLLTDVFTDEFSYQSPTLQWEDVYDTYKALEVNNPNLTYDIVVRSILKKQKTK